MTNSQVFAAFAARAAADGGSVHSERTPKGVVLYSYGTPIAVFADNAERPVFTTRKFSVTTSKQQSGALRACGLVDFECPEDFVTHAKIVGASFALAR